MGDEEREASVDGDGKLVFLPSWREDRIEVGGEVGLVAECFLEGAYEGVGNFPLFVGEKGGVFGPTLCCGFFDNEHPAFIDPRPDERGFADDGTVGVSQEAGFDCFDGERSAGWVPV